MLATPVRPPAAALTQSAPRPPARPGIRAHAEAAILDTMAIRLADHLTTLLEPLMTDDREAAAILAEARERLRCLAGTRYNRRISAASARATRIRRLHRALIGAQRRRRN